MISPLPSPQEICVLRAVQKNHPIRKTRTQGSPLEPTQIDQGEFATIQNTVPEESRNTPPFRKRLLKIAYGVPLQAGLTTRW